MSTRTHVSAFVVLATAADGTSQEIGQFFKVTDADRFLAGLGPSWKSPRIESRQVHRDHVHEAHRSLFPEVFGR